MIDGLFRHTLAVVRTTEGGSLDAEGADLGHGVSSTAVSAAFPGLVQPRTARESPDYLGTGPDVGLFRIYCGIRSIGPDDVIRKSGTVDPDLNGDYRISYVGNAAGVGHHLELVANRLVSTPTAAP